MRLVVFTICLLATVARADSTAVALLPLDADPKLEIYSQLVASELARALGAGGIDVVVIGPRAAVPERARLIVDGTIKAGKGDGVLLTERIRDRESGTVTDTLSSTADSIGTIDRATADLSSRVTPVVAHRLAAFDLPKPVTDGRPAPVPVPVRVPAALPIAVVGIGATAAAFAPLHDALAGAVDAWVRRGHHAPKLVDASRVAPKAVATAHAEIGIVLDVVAYDVVPLALDSGTVPSARARVRLRIENGAKLVFDRVIATDTVLGDRTHALAELVARDVLWIAEPHLREVSTWK